MGEDATQFRKLDARGEEDDGEYAASQSRLKLVASFGCAAGCLECTEGAAPLIVGADATCITNDCFPCSQLFGNGPESGLPAPVNIDQENRRRRRRRRRKGTGSLLAFRPVMANLRATSALQHQ